LEIAALGNEQEVDVAIPDDNEMEVDIIEVQMDEVMMDINKEDPLQPEEVVQGDIEFVDLLPADADAVFEFRDIFDVLLPVVDEEVSKYLIHYNEYWLQFFLLQLSF